MLLFNFTDKPKQTMWTDRKVYRNLLMLERRERIRPVIVRISACYVATQNPALNEAKIKGTCGKFCLH